MTENEEKAAWLRGAMTIKDFSRWAGIGRTKVYEEIADKRLAPFKIGNRTLVTYVEAVRWLRAHAQPGVPVVQEGRIKW